VFMRSPEIGVAMDRAGFRDEVKSL